MIDMTVLFDKLIMLFIIMCVGFLAHKCSILDDATNKKLNKFLVNITLPMTIINSVLTMTNRPDGKSVFLVFIISIAIYLLLPVICLLVVKLFRFPLKHQGLFTFMLVFSNVGFMGFPILEAAFGENGATAVFYAAILNIIFNCSAFTYGIVLIGYGSEKDTSINLKSLLTPGIVCSLLSIAIYAWNVHFPSAVEGAVSYIGSMTSPLAMILIGSTLASMNLKEIFNEKSVYLLSALKLIVIPLICYPLFKMFITDKLICGVMFIEMLMPIANTSLIFATEYDLDTKITSKAIFISTALSLISLPIMLTIFN